MNANYIYEVFEDDELDFLARVRATGDEKLIAEVEAKYGRLG